MEGGFMYYLKLFDETLLKFDMDNTITLKISNIQILSADKKRFPEALQFEVNEETITEFLEQRIVPKNRTVELTNVAKDWFILCAIVSMSFVTLDKISPIKCLS